MKDVSIPDRSEVQCGQLVLKKWEVKNTGNSGWPINTRLTFFRGDRIFTAQDSFEVPLAQSGEVVEVTAILKTPEIPGRITAYFRLADPDGKYFGATLWVDVLVVSDKNDGASEEYTPAELLSIIEQEQQTLRWNENDMRTEADL